MARSRSESDASASDAPATPGKRRYVTWNSDAAEVLLRLRYDTMQRAFASHTNPLEVAALWATLMMHLKRLTGREFTSHQCQGKLKALRTKWKVAMTRKGKKTGRSSHEDFEKQAIKWIAGVNAAKRAKDKASKKGGKKNKQNRDDASTTEAPTESFAELLSKLAEPTATASIKPRRIPGCSDDLTEPVEDYDYGFTNDNDDEADQEEQASRVHEDEQSLLHLLRRQTKAVEAIGNPISSPSTSPHDEWVEISREQTQLAREQVELNLFLIRADPEDAVAQEYLMLKRRQARDRLKSEIAARERREARTMAAAADPSRVAISPLERVV